MLIRSIALLIATSGAKKEMRMQPYGTCKGASCSLRVAAACDHQQRMVPRQLRMKPALFTSLVLEHGSSSAHKACYSIA